jgi:glucosyl-3-phosphoglycerate synthase
MNGSTALPLRLLGFRAEVEPSPRSLAELKARLGLTVSVCLPAQNEEATVGHIVATVRRELVERAGLVDEVVVLDDGSTDATAEAARWEGAAVHAVSDVLQASGPGQGKGNALWKSLYVAEGDLVCWIDADVRNFSSRFVTSLLVPLFNDPSIGFVKGYYRRPLDTQPTGGGRVTELVARPLLSALFPHLAHIVQPLAGEYAGRRELLERVPFVAGWGVELGLLIDLATEFGVDAITQRDLGVREHRNRPLDQLAPQAMEVLLTALRRAGVPPMLVSTTLVRFDEDHTPDLVAIDVGERPPMLTVPEYRAKFGRELTA